MGDDDESEEDDKKDKKDKKGNKGKKDKKGKDKKKKGGKRDLDSDVNVEDIDLRRQFEEATRGIVGEECEEGTRALGGSYQIGRATRKEILDGCAWLVSGVSSGDKLFFHYSGHGTQVADTDGDEEDGMDEALCPADFRVNGVIVDDLLHEVLVRKVPAGVQLTAIMDCCHSGTVLDLPYIYQAKGDKPKESIKVEKKKKKSKKKKDKDKKDRDKPKLKEKEDHGDGFVVMFSGCDDSQV